MSDTAITEQKKSPTKPSLSILYPAEDGQPLACLAKSFFPKAGSLVLGSQNGDRPREDSTSAEQALLSNQIGLYYLAGFFDTNVKPLYCEMNGTRRNITNRLQDSEQNDLFDTFSSENENCALPNAGKPDSSDIVKVNFMSLTVNGLRILFAKTVTFNMLMTVRAVAF